MYGRPYPCPCEFGPLLFLGEPPSFFLSCGPRYGEEGQLVEFTKPSENAAYVLSSLGQPTTALVKMDLATGKTLETIASSELTNVGGIVIGDRWQWACTYVCACACAYVCRCI